MKNPVKNPIQKIKLVANKRFKIPHSDLLERSISSFSHSEKIVFWVLVSVFIVSSFGIFSKVNDSILVEIESHGGSFSEGIVGSPRFINPVLALSDTDRDLVSLVYSRHKPGGFFK